MKLLHAAKAKVVFATQWFWKLSLLKKIIIFMLFVGVLWFGGSQILAATQKQEIQYQTAKVEKGTLVTSVTASGTVSSGNSASITSNATGIVKELYVKNGDTVSAGDAIALVSLDQSAQAEQTQAWASYLSAQNNLNAAKSKMNSLQAALFKANQEFVTDAGTDSPDTADPKYIMEKATWQQAEADYNNQSGVIAQAEAALSSASLAYAQLSATITAPMSGVVSNLSITPGLSISNTNSSSSSNSDSSSSNTSASNTFGTITLAESTPQASVNLSEIDVTKVKVGQKVTMTLDAFTGKTFTGKVAAINTNGTTTSGVTVYPVTLSFDTAVDNMYPNMAVSATIITDVKSDVLLVPVGAVQTSNGESTVRVMRAGQVSVVSVTTGDSNDTQIEILSGLTEGESVVTGQTGGTTTRVSGQTTSPFGSTGFGGRSGGNASGGGSGQSQIRIQTR